MRGYHLCFLLVLLLCFCACNGKSEKGGSTDKLTGIEAKGDLKYARLLSITKHDGYTRVEVRTKEGAKPVASYLLVPEGMKSPDEKGDVIRVPVRSLVVNSSVYAYPLKELGKLGVVKGVTDAPYFAMPEIQAGLKDGTLTDLGNSQSPLVEKIVEMSPDGILINLYEGMNVGQLPTAGVPYIKFADNMESTPLGRAEWIKLLGELTGRQAEADSIFKIVEARYKELSALTTTAKQKPKVLTENMYEGVWYVPGGKSMATQMLLDAGAEYPWSTDKSAGSLSLSFEEVLDKAGEADVWLLKVFGIDLDRKTLSDMDQRYSQFRPFKTGNIWYSNTSTSGLYDVAAFHPEVVLREYIAIFHPELQKDFKPIYFKKIAQ